MGYLTIALRVSILVLTFPNNISFRKVKYLALTSRGFDLSSCPFFFSSFVCFFLSLLNSSLHHDFALVYLQTRASMKVYCPLSFKIYTLKVGHSASATPCTCGNWCCVNSETCPSNKRCPAFCPGPSGCLGYNLCRKKTEVDMSQYKEKRREILENRQRNMCRCIQHVPSLLSSERKMFFATHHEDLILD